MASMSPATPNPRNSGHSPSFPPAASTPPLRFSTVVSANVGLWAGDSTALILDIRAHAAYSAARVPCAVSLSVPSTLLKRPLFSLHRLAEMLPSATARARFSAWRSASRILVYDADSGSISESSNIYGLLRKFKSDGFQGDLAWLQGGFQAIWRERRDIIDAHPPTPDAENDDEDEDAEKSSLTQPQSSVLRTRHLPMAAFSFSSTTVNSSPSINPSNPKRGPLARGATFPTLPTPSQTVPQPAFNPFFDAVRQNLELSQGITERIPLCLSRRVRHRVHDLPFPWLREIARRAAKLAPHNRPAIDSSSSTSEESEDDENITSTDVEEGKEALAMQFFKIEVTEQRRLMGIMEHHAKETVIVTSDMGATSSPNFPYSITAGVEKGAKNRYRHIWPFEHARVRLHQRREADDDYVNASYVQPLGTNKRYIATQGPLPATFTDFWTLCWEQNVHVIVMLTREVENSMVKCGSYWTESEYGPLRLRLISTTGASSPPEENGLFPSRPASHRHLTSPSPQLHQQRPKSRYHPRKSAIIRRVFELTHTDYPDAPTRRIIHLQYLEWPDLNVPDDSRGILELLQEVDNATNETQGLEDTAPFGSSSAFGETTLAIDEKTGVSKQALSGKRPVLLHCSAGVGRTGGFIAVDAVLDAVRRELRAKRVSAEPTKNEDAMDVDVPTPAPVNVASVKPEKDPSVSNRGSTMGTVSITINTGNGPKGPKRNSGYVVHVPIVPTPSSDGTDPEASGSEKESQLRDHITSAAAVSMNTRAWAEDVSRHDYSANPPEPQYQPQTSEFEPHPSSSSQNSQLIIPSDSSSSSDHSLLDLPGANGYPDTTGANSHYPFPQSSSFATSVATVSSPEPSPPRNEPPPNLLRNPENPTPSMFLSADYVPVGSASVPLQPSKTSIDGGLEAHSRTKGDIGRKDSSASQPPSGWLGGPLRNRSPSPVARTTSGESAASPLKRYTKPSFTLRVPPFTAGFSSDTEPPSRSVSPSADEGSIASQVSSYHSHLKQHHYQPIYHKSLPVSLDKSDPGRNARNLRLLAPVPERPNSPAASQSVPSGQGSGSATTAEFKQPRPLHSTATPPLLSSFEDPIYEIVQDMREQRMSLCQSLRQYVFVHAAILEGALMIVDEERGLNKEEERERVVETDNLKLESERRGEAEGSKVVPPKGPINESGDVGGSGKRLEESSRSSAGSSREVPKVAGTPAPGVGTRPRPFLGQPDMVPTSASTARTSSTIIPNRTMQDEVEGYFGGFVSQPPITFGMTIIQGADERTLETVFSPRPRLPVGAVLSSVVPLQRHDVHFGGKRSTSPSDYLKDGVGGLDYDGPFQRLSAKRKQPSGEAGEIVTRKRAQNESSSRERERERERERQIEGRLNNSSHAPSRDGIVDVLASGLVR